MKKEYKIKKILSLAIVVEIGVLASGASGNTIPSSMPFLNEGKVWVYERTFRYTSSDCQDGELSQLLEQRIECDDVKGERECKKLVRKVSRMAGVSYEPLEEEESWMTEGNGIVYQFFGYPHNDWEPLYDFSLGVGDSFTRYFIEEQGIEPGSAVYVIAADDRILVKGREYRRLAIANAEGQIVDYWVEGIGGYGSIKITSYNLPAPGGGSDGGGCLVVFSNIPIIEVYEDGKLIFEYDDFTTDNVVSSVSLTEADDAQPVRYYDLQGRELINAPSDGLYIERRGNTTLKVLR